MSSSLVESSNEKIEDISGTGSVDLISSLHIDLLSRGLLKLYVVWIIPFLATFVAGYAISTQTAINALPSYKAFFNFNGLGVSSGLVFALWPIAACATFWIGPIISDRWGRRTGIFICALIYILATGLIASARGLGMLLSGRFLLGAATGMIQSSAPPYIVETAPPLNRGLLTGMFNVCWLIGSTVGTAVTIGTVSISSDWGWRLPVVIQLIFPTMMATTIFFLPESPRWLYSHGHKDQARQMLIKYHGDGHLTPVVVVEMNQIAQAHELASGLKVGTESGGYGELVATRGNRYRLMLALMMGVFGQLSGNGLNLFLPALYAQVGVSSVHSQLIMVLIATLVALVAALVGTYHTDKLGRRKVLILGSSLCALCLACAMGTSAASGVTLSSSTSLRAANLRVQDTVSSPNESASKAAISFLILFGAAYAWGCTPLQPIYPSEVLSMEMRSKGMACMVLALNLASVLNQFAIPVALEKVYNPIGYWTYLPFIIWDTLETAAWYFLGVETKGRTLEELDEVFNSPNPVKASLKHTRSGTDVEAKPKAEVDLTRGVPI